MRSQEETVVHANAVDVEEMRSKLLTLDDVRERLARTEPLTDRVFEAPQRRSGWRTAGPPPRTTPTW